MEKIALHERARKNLGDIQALAADILENGQLTPGLVRRATDADEDDGIDPEKTPWVLVAGGRRYTACCLAGLDTFKAEDRGNLPPLQQKIFELSENLNREDLDWAEQAQLRKEIHFLRARQAEAEGKKWTQADTAAEYGLSTAQLSKDIEIATAIEADPELKKAGSKKAAVRIVEFREHVKRQEQRLSDSIGRSSLRERLQHADARTWLRQQPTGSADLVLTDSPWAIDYHSTGRKDQPESYSSDYDDSEAVTLDLLVDVVPEIVRITKDTGWIVAFMAESNMAFLRDLFETCCTTHFEYGEVWYEQDPVAGTWEKQMPTRCTVGKLPQRKDEPCAFLRAEVPSWIWFRPNSLNPTRLPERHAKNFYEPILVLNRGHGRLYKHQDDCPNVLVFDADYGDARVHSNQKPLGLGEEIIARTTLAGESVVDPFAGSGNFLAAAAKLNRRLSGCELNPLTYDLALGNVGRYYNG